MSSKGKKKAREEQEFQSERDTAAKNLSATLLDESNLSKSERKALQKQRQAEEKEKKRAAKAAKKEAAIEAKRRSKALQKGEQGGNDHFIGSVEGTNDSARDEAFESAPRTFDASLLRGQWMADDVFKGDEAAYLSGHDTVSRRDKGSNRGKAKRKLL